MARLRLGVALLLAPPVAEQVDGLRRALDDGSLGRVPPHVTLVPPVNVRLEDLSRALAVLRAAAAATGPRICVTLGPPSSFLPANPVLYLPVGGDVGAVHALRARVWQPPLTRALTWPFVPHVTLADDASPERIEAARTALSGYVTAVAFDRVHLLVERRPGPRWCPLADVAFGPPAIVARGGPLAVELVRSLQIDPEAAALLRAEGAEVPVPGWGPESPGLGAPGVGAPGVGVPEAIRGPLVVTARRQGEVVGVAAGWLTPDGCRSAVLVATPHRRQGIGRHLEAALRAAIDDAGWGRHHPDPPPRQDRSGTAR